MILYDRPDLVSEFIAQNGGGFESPLSSQGFLWIDAGVPKAAIQFFRFRQGSVYSSIASTAGVFPRGLLKVAGQYAFGQLECRRLTYEIAASNLKSIKFVTALGAYHEATLQDGYPDDDLLIYCLRPDRCTFWRKLCQVVEAPQRHQTQQKP